MTVIGEELLERGHRVSMLLSASYPELERLRNESGFRIVDYVVRENDFYTIDHERAGHDIVGNALRMDPDEEFRNNIKGSYHLENKFSHYPKITLSMLP